MEATLRKRFRLFVFLPVACVLILVHGVAPSEAAVNGTVRQVGNQQILNLWGTYYEMGYAHGYLMADKIRDLVEHYMIGTIAGGNVAAYNALVAKGGDPNEFQWLQQSLDEINGMADGMAASGKNLYVAGLGRNIDARDIRAFNLQEEFYFSCSSFGVWGNATAGGETILARNFDFFYDNQGNIANYQIIIAYEPTGKAKFISFAWPAMIGVFSGMNESGVSLLDNTGNMNNPYSGPYHPVLEVFRNILENTTSANYLTEPLSIVDSFYELTPEIIQIGIPYQGSGNPVYYIEESPDWNAIRYPADTDPDYNHIIATNHFIKVIPPPLSGDSVTRYNTIRNGLINLYGTGDRKVDSTEARSLLRSVADIVAPTLTSVIIRSNRMEFDLSFAKMVNGIFTSAKDIQPQTYAWTSLFPDHEALSDLVVQSVVAVPANPGVGQSVAVTVTVKNQGSTDAGSYSIDFYQNLASAPASRQAGDANCVKNGLAAGATDSCTFTTTFSAAGSYKMWAQADTEQQVPESDENNNVFGPQAITAGPVAVNDAYGTGANAALDQAAPGVLGNDSAPEGAVLTAQLASGPSHGTLTLNADGSFSYTPASNYAGSDSFTYVANDGTTNSNIATVTITVASTSGVLFSDDFTRAQLSPWISALGTWTITNNVLQGSSSLSTYASIHTETTPLWTDYSVEGQVQFPAGAFGGGIGGRVNPATGARYSAWVYPSGSLGGSNVLKLVKFRSWTSWSGTPMQQVSLPNVGTGWHTLKMVFKGSQLQVSYDGTLMINVTDNNFDSRAPYLTGGISADLWTYTTSYVMGVDNIIVRTLTANSPPVAADDAYSTNVNTTLNQAAPGVLANDTDPEGGVLTAQLASTPSHGTLTLNANGSFTYTPTANYAGSDSFTYTANDGTANSNVATATITVTQAANLPPVAANDAYSTNVNTTLNQAAPGVLANDTDPEGGVLTAQLASTPSHGTLTLNANGSFVYTPTANYAGSDSFTYTANDGTNSSNAATATITVLSTSALSSLSLNPTSVVGGSTSQGTVTLSGPAPSGGAVVSLSDDSPAATVPASVTVPAGSTSATFTITTSPVGSSTAVTISAVYGGVTKTAVLTVNRPALSTLSLNPTSVVGGSTSQGRVTLTGPAPSGGAVVSLSDNSSAASEPASVTVPGGSTSATFTITTSPVSSSTAVTISAVYNGVTKTAVLTVNRPALSTLTLSPTTVKGGATSQGTVRLSGPAPTGGIVVSLSDNSQYASEPASVTVPANSTSATFTITTTRVNRSRSVTISAASGGVTKTAVLTVTR
jgi:VCBS repeat-containing protein